MKKIVLALTVALLGTIVMNAQPPRRHDMSPEQMVEKRVERLDRALSLTAEQKAAITKIYSDDMQAKAKERPAKKERVAKPDEETMKANREQFKAHREAVNAQIEAVLTPEQAAKFTEIKKHEGRHGRGHRGPKDAVMRNHAGDHKGSCCEKK